MIDTIIDSIYLNKNVSMIDIDTMFTNLLGANSALYGKTIIDALPEFIYQQNLQNKFGANSIYYSTKYRRELNCLEIIVGDVMFRFNKNDPVAEIYKKMRISEMARYIDREDNPLTRSEQSRKYAFYNSKNDPIYAKIGGLVTHKFDNGEETMWTTLDHNIQEAVHRSYFVRDTTKSRLPFDHETQESVERTNHPDLPRGYATDIAYMHFTESNVPLSSSNQQQIGGNKMWGRLAHKAFDGGHHVYLLDNANKTMNHLDTKEKVDSGLRYYFTTDQKLKGVDRGHIILSKEKLESS